MEANFLFLNKNSFLKVFSGTVLSLFGLLLIFVSALFFGILFLISGLSLLIKTGVEIDIDNKKYRDIYSFFGLKLGKWKPLPKFDYISVFNAKLKYKTGITAVEHEFKESIYRLLLFYNRNQKIIVYESKSKEKAFDKAKFLSDILNIDILDATTKEKKWLY